MGLGEAGGHRNLGAERREVTQDKVRNPELRQGALKGGSQQDENRVGTGEREGF